MLSFTHAHAGAGTDAGMTCTPTHPPTHTHDVPPYACTCSRCTCSDPYSHQGAQMRALIKNVGASVNLHVHMQVLAQMRARIRGAGKTPKDLYVTPRCHDESRCGCSRDVRMCTYAQERARSLTSKRLRAACGGQASAPAAAQSSMRSLTCWRITSSLLRRSAWKSGESRGLGQKQRSGRREGNGERRRGERAARR